MTDPPRAMLARACALAALAAACDDGPIGECQTDLQCTMGSVCVAGSCLVRLAQPSTWALEVVPEPTSSLAAREWPEFSFGREASVLTVDRRVSMATTLTRSYADTGNTATSVHLVLGVASSLPGRRELQFEADAVNSGLGAAYEAALPVPERLLGATGRLWVAPRAPLSRTMCPWQFEVQVDRTRAVTLPGAEDTLTIEGVLHTAEGAPIPDYEARVVLGERLVSNLARTEPTGRFVLRVQRSLAAQAGGPLPVELAPADPVQPRPTLAVEAPAGVTNLGTLRLPAFRPAVPVVIPLVDAAGKPVAGATVRLQATLAGATGGVARYVRNGQSGPDGRVTLPLIPAPVGGAAVLSYLVKVVPPPAAAAGARCLPGYALGESGAEGLLGPAVQLPERVPVAGVVVTADGEAAVGVKVRATRRGQLFREECLGDLASPPAESRSDAQGHYRLLLDPGTHQLVYEPDRTAALPALVEDAVSVTAATTRNVSLPSPAVAEGRVMAPEGTPVNRAEVRVFVPGPEGAGQVRASATSDADGRFRLVLPVDKVAAGP